MPGPGRHSSIRASLALSALLLLHCACSAAPPRPGTQRTIADGENFSLSVGERVSLSGQGTLTYVALVADSRCPVDVQCVWAGSAEISLRWEPLSGDPDIFSLDSHAGQASHGLGPRLLTLVSVDRGAVPDAHLAIGTLP
jgi:hypothetical protein